MKVETRGKYPGVKLHLEPEECEALIKFAAGSTELTKLSVVTPLILKMGKKIVALKEDNPKLLDERTPEEVKAILAKEVEKAQLQLKTLVQTGQFKEIDKEALKTALLKHV